MNPTGDIHLVVTRFQQWAREAGMSDSLSRVEVEDLGVPHRPVALPVGRQGVYTFQFQSAWLKAGKAGPKSGARWQSQHYKATRSMSNLSWSLLVFAHRSSVEIPCLPPTLREQLRGVHPDEMGDWIKRHTRRVNLLVSGSLDGATLTRLEDIAHEVLRPTFEGRWNR
jgi:hypothetical protein